MRKVVGGFEKKIVLVLVCVTDRHDMTLSVKVALNLNKTNQPFQKRQILVSFKLKQLADDNFEFHVNGEKFSEE